MADSPNLKIEANIICNKCSYIPLIGIKYEYENKNLDEICKLYSYCIFNDKFNVKNFEDIFSKFCFMA